MTRYHNGRPAFGFEARLGAIFERATGMAPPVLDAPHRCPEPATGTRPGTAVLCPVCGRRWIVDAPACATCAAPLPAADVRRGLVRCLRCDLARMGAE